MNASHPSPVVAIYDALRGLDAGGSVEIATPAGPGWIAGAELRLAAAGAFHELLVRIGQRAKTTDRRTIAASFALRYGWASAMAIAPYLRHGCVPDIALDNVSFQFRPSTSFEGTAIHEARGLVAAGDPRAAHPTMGVVADDEALLRALRAALVGQAAPVVDALYDWSGFARLGTWGLLTSSWASQFTAFGDHLDDQRALLPQITGLLAGDDVVARMQPLMHAVTHRGVTHLYQRRASCCRDYLLPEGTLCASCPLVGHDERLARNRAWMDTQLDRRTQGRGHT